MVAQIIQGEISNGSINPRLRTRHFTPMFVQPEKRLLHQIFGRFALTYDAISIAQQCRFLSIE